MRFAFLLLAAAATALFIVTIDGWGPSVASASVLIDGKPPPIVLAPGTTGTVYQGATVSVFIVSPSSIISPIGVVDQPSTLTQDGNDFIEKFGLNPDIDLGQTEDLISWGGTYSFASFGPTGTTIYASSTSSSATNVIKVFGLDTNFDPQNTTFSLAGQASLGIDGIWTRTFRAYNNNSGDIQGDVYFYTTDTATGGIPDTATSIKAHITGTLDPKCNQTVMAVWTVPNEKAGLIHKVYASCEQNKDLTVFLRIREFGKVFRTIYRFELYQGSFEYEFPFPLIFPGKTDIKMTVTSGDNNIRISGGFTVRIIDE